VSTDGSNSRSRFPSRSRARAVSPTVAVTAGIRADSWESETQLNPRLSVLWRAADSLSLSASAYTAFRAPTLNELYRGFRVGNVETLPNAELQSEELTGFEVGARARNVRLTLFVMNVSDTIANVTLSQTPSLITRRRENLGRTRSLGAELDGEWRIGSDWRVSSGLLFVDASVRGGKRVPQVPRVQATAQAMWRRVGAQMRWTSMQFDDDRNELALGSALVVDAFASYPVSRSLEVTFAIENVLDAEVEASATPVVTLGQPRAWRVGVRFVERRRPAG